MVNKSFLIIFDFDGVLADSLNVFEKAMLEKLTELGYSFVKSKKDILDLFDKNVVHSLIEKGMTAEHMKDTWVHLNNTSAKQNIPLFDGISDMLCKLSKKCELSIISSNSSTLIKKVLNKNRVHSCFSKISGGESFADKATRIRESMLETGSNGTSTFYVGDTVGDIIEGNKAKVTTIGATWGWHDEKKLKKAAPHYIVHKPSELTKLITKLAFNKNGG